MRDEPARDTTTTSHNNFGGKAASSTDGLPNFSCSYADVFASYPRRQCGNNAIDAVKNGSAGDNDDKRVNLGKLWNDQWKENGLSSSNLIHPDTADFPLELPQCHPNDSPPQRPRLSTLSLTASPPQSGSGTDMPTIHCRCSSAQMHAFICSGSMGNHSCPSLDDNNGRSDASEEVTYLPRLPSLLPRPLVDIISDYDGSSPILPQSKQGTRQAIGKVEPQGTAIHPQCDDIKEDRAPLPRLRIRGRDPIKLTRLVNEWLQKTAAILDTWSGVAASYWMQVVRAARQLHNSWLSLSPALRVSQLGSPNIGNLLPLQLPVHETVMTAELLNALPSGTVSQVLLEGKVSVMDLLFATFQTLLPSEPRAFRRAIAQVETPLPTAATYSQALTTLRAWKQDILTVVLDMGADPEPATLLSSLRSLLSHLIRRDSLFADEVVHLESVANTQTHCSGDNLLTFIALLETELSSRAFSEESPATNANERRNSEEDSYPCAPIRLGNAHTPTRILQPPYPPILHLADATAMW